MKSVAKRFLRSCGLELKRYSAFNCPDLRRVQIIRSHRIDLVLDVGANIGQYATELRDAGYTGAIVSFEPQKAAFDVLLDRSSKDKEWKCLSLGLADKDGRKRLQLASNSVSSSFLDMTPEMQSAHPDVRFSGSQDVETVQLDTMSADLGLMERRTLLKMDVQGYEERVLAGARKTLPHIELVECELPLVAMYEGQLGLCEMVRFLEQSGYHPVSIDASTLHPERSYVLEVNVLFARA